MACVGYVTSVYMCAAAAAGQELLPALLAAVFRIVPGL